MKPCHFTVRLIDFPTPLKNVQKQEEVFNRVPKAGDEMPLKNLPPPKKTMSAATEKKTVFALALF